MCLEKRKEHVGTRAPNAASYRPTNHLCSSPAHHFPPAACLVSWLLLPLHANAGDCIVPLSANVNVIGKVRAGGVRQGGKGDLSARYEMLRAGENGCDRHLVRGSR